MEGGWETPPVSHQQPKELALPCLTEPAARHTRKKKEAKCLGKIPGMLQSHGDPLGLAVQELHGLGTAQAHTSRVGMGQDWVSTREAWERSLDAGEGQSRIPQFPSLMTRLEGLSCSMAG